MSKQKLSASDLHKNAPPDWYYQSIGVDILQRFWHKRNLT